MGRELVQVGRVRTVATVSYISGVICANTTQWVRYLVCHGSQKIRERLPIRAKRSTNLCKCSKKRIPSSFFINIISNVYWFWMCERKRKWERKKETTTLLRWWACLSLKHLRRLPMKRIFNFILYIRRHYKPFIESPLINLKYVNDFQKLNLLGYEFN